MTFEDDIEAAIRALDSMTVGVEDKTLSDASNDRVAFESSILSAIDEISSMSIGIEPPPAKKMAKTTSVRTTAAKVKRTAAPKAAAAVKELIVGYEDLATILDDLIRYLPSLIVEGMKAGDIKSLLGSIDLALKIRQTLHGAPPTPVTVPSEEVTPVEGGA